MCIAVIIGFFITKKKLGFVNTSQIIASYSSAQQANHEIQKIMTPYKKKINEYNIELQSIQYLYSKKETGIPSSVTCSVPGSITVSFTDSARLNSEMIFSAFNGWGLKKSRSSDKR